MEPLNQSIQQMLAALQQRRIAAQQSNPLLPEVVDLTRQEDVHPLLPPPPPFNGAFPTFAPPFAGTMPFNPMVSHQQLLSPRRAALFIQQQQNGPHMTIPQPAYPGLVIRAPQFPVVTDDRVTGQNKQRYIPQSLLQIRQQPHVDQRVALKAILDGVQQKTQTTSHAEDEKSTSKNNEMDPPPNLLLTPLMKHQRKALAWMFDREMKGSPPPRGGILADDQGLGKTVTTIALLLSAPPDVVEEERRARQFLFNGPLSSQHAQKQEDESVSVQDEEEEGDDDDELNEQEERKPDDVCEEETTVIIDISSSDDDVGKDMDYVPTLKIQVQGVEDEEIVDLLDDEDSGADDDDVRDLATPAPQPLSSAAPCAAPAAKDKYIKDKETAARKSEADCIHGQTLIVAPTSLVHQWADEIKKKVSPAANYTVYIYHGKDRAVSAAYLAKYTVILTTYTVLSLDAPESIRLDKSKLRSNNGLNDYDTRPYRMRGGSLFKVKWHRVVLDEAQVVKNAKTLGAHAAWHLKAERRWCLSGTPIQNSVEDMYSYFRFLHFEPYNKYSTFKTRIRDPIVLEKHAALGYQRLQEALNTIMLRRTKKTEIDGAPIIQLPERRVDLLQVEFSEAEREFYDQLWFNAKEMVNGFKAQGNVNSNYANMLWLLLRLRQACNHPSLVKGSAFKFQAGSAAHQPSAVVAQQIQGIKALSEEVRASLRSVLTQNETPLQCVVCGDIPEDASVSQCAHVFCEQCVASSFSSTVQDNPSFDCQACGQTLHSHELFCGEAFDQLASSPGGGTTAPSSTGFREVRAEHRHLMNFPPSTKVTAFMKLMRQLHGRDEEGLQAQKKELSDEAQLPPLKKQKGDVGQVVDKVIVFSQWTSMLDLLEPFLSAEKFKFCRLDGTMTVKDRSSAISEFTHNPSTTILLVSLKAASLGLNLISANHVILIDLWWNPQVEAQAIDRAHRIGQTRAVQVHKITVKDSVEDRILELQRKKQRMAATAFGEEVEGEQQGRGLGARLTAQDLLYLFG